MSTVHLPDDLSERLALEAARRHMTVDDLAAEALAASFPPVSDPARRRVLPFAAIGGSGSARGGARADELLAEGFGCD